MQHHCLHRARRPQRRAKRLFDALPEETESPDDEGEDGAAAAEDDNDLLVDLDLKAPPEEGAHLDSNCKALMQHRVACPIHDSVIRGATQTSLPRQLLAPVCRR